MNSWYNEIKTMYILLINIIVFIFWCFFQCVFFYININTYVFLLNTIGVYLIVYLSRKLFVDINANYRSVVISIIINLLFSPILYFAFNFSMVSILINYIYIICILYLIRTFSDHLFSYIEYKNNIKIILILAMVVGIIMNIFYDNIMRNLYAFYLILIVLSIMILRESRNYDYSIRNKNSKKINLSIFAITMILSIEPIYNSIYKVFTIIKDFMLGVLDKVIYYPLLLIGTIFNFIRLLILKLVKIDNVTNGGSSNIEKNPLNIIEDKKILETNLGSEGYFFEIIRMVVYIFLLVIAGFIIVYVLSCIGKSKKCKESKLKKDDYDEIEKIKINENNKSKYKLFNFIKAPKNIANIRKTYRKFLKICHNKKIFKTYMSSTALSNVLKMNIDKSEELNEIANIYNEAKFSNHKINEDKVSNIKRNYENIKDDLDKINYVK